MSHIWTGFIHMRNLYELKPTYPTEAMLGFVVPWATAVLCSPIHLYSTELQTFVKLRWKCETKCVWLQILHEPMQLNYASCECSSRIIFGVLWWGLWAPRIVNWRILLNTEVKYGTAICKIQQNSVILLIGWRYWIPVFWTDWNTISGNKYKQQCDRQTDRQTAINNLSLCSEQVVVFCSSVRLYSTELKTFGNFCNT